MKNGQVNLNGKILGLWPLGLPTNSSPSVSKAFAVVNDEMVSSATGTVKRFFDKRAAINADTELSATGKQARIRDAAHSALAELKRSASAVRALEAEYRTRASTAVVIPEPSMNDTLVDLALAAHARAAGQIPTLLEQASERLRVALVRMPEELSGIKPEVKERLRGSLVNPHTAHALGEDSAAISAARGSVQRAIEEIAPLADHLSPRDKAAIVGEGWRVPGFPESLGKLDAAMAAQAAL